MATSSLVSAGRRSFIAVCQLSVQHDLNDNFRRSAQLIERAANNRGCKVKLEKLLVNWHNCCVSYRNRS